MFEGPTINNNQEEKDTNAAAHGYKNTVVGTPNAYKYSIMLMVSNTLCTSIQDRERNASSSTSLSVQNRKKLVTVPSFLAFLSSPRGIVPMILKETWRSGF